MRPRNAIALAIVLLPIAVLFALTINAFGPTIGFFLAGSVVWVVAVSGFVVIASLVTLYLAGERAIALLYDASAS